MKAAYRFSKSPTEIIFKKIEMTKAQVDEEEFQYVQDKDHVARNIKSLLLEAGVNCARWDKEGAISLLDTDINDRGETIVHYVCQTLNVELASHLVDFYMFFRLVSSTNSNNSPNLDKFSFREYILRPNVDGECALLQCLKRLDANNKNEKLIQIIALFFTGDLITYPSASKVGYPLAHFLSNFYIRRSGWPGKPNKLDKSILHFLIEREQADLLRLYIETFTFGYDHFEPLEYTTKDYLGRTPLAVAFETGNQEIIKEIYRHAKYQTPAKDLEKLKAFIELQNETKAGTLLDAILRNKMVITGNKDVKNLLIGEKIVELDGKNFDTLWHSYKCIGHNFPTHAVDDKNEKSKNIIIRAINAKLAQENSLVFLKVDNFFHFDQIDDFLHFLPYNFKIIFVSPTNLKSYPFIKTIKFD